jgi:hypothetical protein
MFTVLKKCRSCWTSPAILDRSLHMEILKESLLRALQDIDLTFSKEGLIYIRKLNFFMHIHNY